MLRAKRDGNPVVLRPLRPLKLADAERTISLTWLDLGSVSTGYSDRPVARAIKIKHAGLNLTGRASGASEKKKASSRKLDKKEL